MWCHCKECDSRIQKLQLKEEGLALKYSKQIRQYHAAVNRIMERTFVQIDRELHVLYNDQFELIQEIIQERQNVKREVEQVRQDTRKHIKILKAGVKQIPGLILDDSHLGGQELSDNNDITRLEDYVSENDDPYGIIKEFEEGLLKTHLLNNLRGFGSRLERMTEELKNLRKIKKTKEKLQRAFK